MNAQFEQLPADALGTPQAIVERYRFDQQEHPIRLRTGWSFELTPKHDQLLTQQRIFGQEFSPGVGKIVQCSTQERVVGWPRALKQALVHARAMTVNLALEGDEQT